MARNNNKSRFKKIEPAALTMSFILPAGAATVNTIDLSQCASLMNRRFYRQGLNWAVAGFRVISPSGVTGSLSITKLPNTWVMSNAWEKGMRTWMKMNKESLAETESIRPKFLDFKVYANSTHHTAGVGANLLPIDGAANPYTPGEWEASKVIIPKTDGTDDVVTREIIATGASYPGAGASGFNAVSLIEGYAASRGLPDVLDPNAPDDAASTSQGGGINAENWLAAIFNEGTDQDREVLEDMISENNIAPYPFENDGVNPDTMYPGGANQAPTLEYHDSAFITGTTIGGITPMRGTNFPCGLLQIGHNLTAPVEGAVLFQIDMVPGTHRGYLCEPMTEM